jgi:phosphohistidine swiveling domain-containing protein
MIPSWIKDVKRFATRPMTVQRVEIIGNMYEGLVKTRALCIPLEKGIVTSLIEKSDMEKAYRIISRHLSTPEGWKAHLENYKKCREQMHRAAETAAKTARRPFGTWRGAYEDWLGAMRKFGYFFIAPFSIEEYLDPKCRRLLQAEFGKGADELFGIISSPSEMNDFQKMRLRILDSVIKETNDYDEIAQEYGWYNEYSFIEKLFDAKHFEKEAKKLDSEKARAERDKILNAAEKNRTAYLELRKKLKNPELRLLAEIIHTYTFLRTKRIEEFKKAQVKMRIFFDALAEDLGAETGKRWTREMVVACTNQELRDYLSKHKVPERSEILKRIGQKYVYYYEDGKPFFTYDKKEMERIIKIVSETEKSGQIKGVTAYGGKAKGRVVIVHSKEDLNKVKKGDVLVAEITLQDYITAIRRAVALVTEEGGITSHAAIIAREMKLPCIVGTQTATKVLKDGDYVEVDANKGIVKRLK